MLEGETKGDSWWFFLYKSSCSVPLLLAGLMSFRTRQVRDVLESLGLGEFDDAVCGALLALGKQGVDQPFTALQVQASLRNANLRASSVANVLDVLDEADPEKREKLAATCMRAPPQTRVLVSLPCFR